MHHAAATVIHSKQQLQHGTLFATTHASGFSGTPAAASSSGLYYAAECSSGGGSPGTAEHHSAGRIGTTVTPLRSERLRLVVAHSETTAGSGTRKVVTTSNTLPVREAAVATAASLSISF